MGEITVILLLALLVIGPKGLPDMAATLGKLIRDFRKTAADVKKEIQIDDHIRKPFEELRDAITLSPEELQRRDRIKKEIENLQKKVVESENEMRAAAEAQAAASSEGELPPQESESEGESARIAAAHAPTLPAPASGSVVSAEPADVSTSPAQPGGKTLGFGSAPVAPSGLAIPVRAPEGTIARGASGRITQARGEAVPPAPPPVGLPAPSLPAPSQGSSTSPSHASATGPTTPPHLPGPPLPSSPFRRTSPRVAPLPGPPAAPASGVNVTQVLVEADIMSGAGGPPPPPRATLASRPVPPSSGPHSAPESAPVSSDDDESPV